MNVPSPSASSIDVASLAPPFDTPLFDAPLFDANGDAVPDALLAALDRDDDDAGSMRACAWVSLVGLASPESVGPVVAGVAARLFDAGVPLARRVQLASALAGAGAGFTGTLVERLCSLDDEHRLVAARALAAPRHLEAVTALVRVASDVDASARVRSAAIDAIAAIGDRSAVGDVAWLVDDASALVRRAAVVALRALDPSRARAKWFARAADDDDVDVRCAALAALLVVGGPPACTAARLALDDDSGAVRALAIVTLARHGSVRDAGRVRARCDDDDARVRRAVREAASTFAARAA